MNTRTDSVRIKFEVAPDQVERLKHYLAQKPALIEPPHHESFTYTYLDTKDRKLREQGFSLCVREDGEPALELVAQPNGSAYRYFDTVIWRGKIEGTGLAHDLPSDVLPPHLTEKVSGSLRPLFKVGVDTKRFLISHGNSEIEALLGDGTVTADRGSVSYCEIRFSSRSGDASNLFSYVLGIDETIPLRLGAVTDAERGYRLLREENVTAVKRHPLVLANDLSCADAFRIIAHSCLQHVVANEQAMSEGDAEALHQARIGLRRLRTALSLFAGVCGDTQLRTIKCELEWLSDLLGPARDLDVFLSEVMLPLREAYREEPGLLSLQRTYGALRSKLYAKVAEAVNSVRFRALVLETAAWIETGSWAINQSSDAREARAQRVDIFAMNELNRRRKKVKKKGAHLANLGPDERHQLRIHVKRLRYSAEFFASLFPAKKKTKRAFLSALEALQGALGDVNDIAVRAGLKSDVIAERKGRVDWEKQQHRAFAAGLIIGHQRAHLESLIEKAETAYSDFVEMKPFWQGFEPKHEAPQSKEIEQSRAKVTQGRFDFANDDRADEAA